MHTQLLTEVLSSDYEDLTNDGPTDDDLGSYTKISYIKKDSNYRWRVPFENNKATLNRGFNSLQRDEMGNYIYGEKELFYVNKIETKTHIAVFELSTRDDGYGVIDENGGLSQSSKMYKIDKIYLYSKPEYKKLTNTQTFDDLTELEKSKSSIKVAHFDYDYSLCQGVPNNSVAGKLTLKKVYFTYRGSHMGKYTPYEFNYEGLNPDYNLKAYNMWGNYKEYEASMGLNPLDNATPSEFPYVDQADRNLQNDYASAWTMTSIDLPSGGKIELTYEADDYAYVQDKKAMQMLKVRGVSDNNSTLGNNLLYNNNSVSNFIHVELPNEDSNLPLIDNATFIDKYLSEIIDKPIFFKFMLQMKKNRNYDFVSGYFHVDQTKEDEINVFSNNSKVYAAIPVRLVHKNKSEFDANGENPFSKAGWYFGRQYLNRIVYGQDENSENFSLEDFVGTIANQIPGMFSIFQSPNNELKNERCAQKFSTSKSWVRLQNPNGKKIGGGLRVAKLEMFDQWDKMTNNFNQDLYKMSYGQEYNYEGVDGKSSGVATFEPMGSKENPFIEPFYDSVNDDRLLAPEEKNFTEKPFGTSFFPSPKITYSQISVSNIENGNIGTGKVLNKFYTSKDFPTIAKHTKIDDNDLNLVNYPEGGISLIQSMFDLNFKTDKRISVSQGFVVVKNDMNGKQKSQQVYAENSEENSTPISKVNYYYNIDENGKMYNNLPVIHKDGSVTQETLGVDYNVVNDFRQSKSNLTSYGADINLAIIPAAFIPIGISSATAQFAEHNSDMRLSTTTKVIHKAGILVEKRAFDLGAEVKTKNIAWDAQTGQVLLTQTNNEYENDKYYNFNYPAYWGYKGMDMASKNIGIELEIDNGSQNEFTIQGSFNEDDYLHNGDKVLINDNDLGWVTNVDADSFELIDVDGFYISTANKIKVMTSGYKNQQSANMASITLMENPIDVNGDGNFNAITDLTFEASNWDDKHIVNASAVRYDDIWPTTCDCDMPEMKFDNLGNLIFEHEDPTLAYNPYLYNVKGEWRAKESLAYLTGRHTNEVNSNPRNSGFFNDYTAYYKPDGQGNWDIDDPEEKWTSASQVTEYSPYGAELENKDALGRYSAAQYGYNYNFPVAVASNSEYREIGFDSFEEDRSPDCSDEASDHFYFKGNAENPIEIVASTSHTGNKSLKLTAGSTADMQKTVDINCYTPDVLTLFADLILYLQTLVTSPDYEPQEGCFTPDLLIPLIPYMNIEDSNGNQIDVTPQICNLVYEQNFENPDNTQLYFSFTPNDTFGNPPYPSYVSDNGFNANSSHIVDVFVLMIGGNTITGNGVIPTDQDGAGYDILAGFSNATNDNVRGIYTRYINFEQPERCPDCTTFSPMINNRYVLSSWVKVDTPLNGTTPEDYLASQPTTYQNVGVNVRFFDAAENEFTNAQVNLEPSGEIVDGWQRVTGTVPIPSVSANSSLSVATMSIELDNNSSHDVYFDDVRMHPYHGNMKGFVYDNENYRLMAELDENNFATFYEYDNEGGLVRVKKETERGIMTIQETRSSTAKNVE